VCRGVREKQKGFAFGRAAESQKKLFREKKTRRGAAKFPESTPSHRAFIGKKPPPALGGFKGGTQPDIRRVAPEKNPTRMFVIIKEKGTGVEQKKKETTVLRTHGKEVIHQGSPSHSKTVPQTLGKKRRKPFGKGFNCKKCFKKWG